MNVYTLEEMNDLPAGTCIQDAKLKLINNIEYYEGTVSFRGCSFETSVLASMCEERNNTPHKELLEKMSVARTNSAIKTLKDLSLKNKRERLTTYIVINNTGLGGLPIGTKLIDCVQDTSDQNFIVGKAEHTGSTWCIAKSKVRPIANDTAQENISVLLKQVIIDLAKLQADIQYIADLNRSYYGN
jgi:hypothetical protein